MVLYVLRWCRFGRDVLEPHGQNSAVSLCVCQPVKRNFNVQLGVSPFGCGSWQWLFLRPICRRT